MKKIFGIFITVLLLFSLSACGGDSQSPEQENEQTEQEASTQSNLEQGAICEHYKIYSNAKNDFDDYVLQMSKNHEVVSVRLGEATVTELKILDYLLPLEFLGQSIKATGSFDAEMEKGMLETGWADDVEVTCCESGYMVKGTDTNGCKLEIQAVYVAEKDSLRLEGYKDGNLELVFEYTKTPGGYASQYICKAITGNDKGKPIEEMVTYKHIFNTSNGSCARFDGAYEPTSILDQTPEEASFIEGASQWFTITDGTFTGNLGGEAF